MDDDTLRQWWSEGDRAWPSLELPIASFRAFLEDKPDADGRHAADLFLAAGCANRDERAIALFRQRHEADVRAAVHKGAPSGMADDAVQLVLTKLFVGVEDEPASINKYGGRGKLQTWIRVVARRTASNLRRDDPGGRDVELRESDALMEYATTDAVLAPLKRAYRAVFRAAFASAIDQLSARDRNVLRYECIDRLSRAEIANLHGVTVVTISRWRAATRVRLRTMTREAFVATAGIDDDEFKSVMDLIASRLEVSLTRLLGEGSE